MQRSWWGLLIACALVSSSCDAGTDESAPSAGGPGDAATTDATTDAASDTTSDATSDAASETGLDAAVDAATDSTIDDDGALDGAVSDALVDAPYVPPDAVVVPPLPSFDAGVLPHNEAGVPVLSTGSGVQIGLAGAPRGPVNALAGCAGLISGCYQPGVRSLDACVLSMPKCATAKPWEESAACCPASCVERYEAARIAGAPPQAAAYTVLFKSPRCIPGLDDALGGKP